MLREPCLECTPASSACRVYHARMAEHPNLVLLRRGMAAFAAHDLATLKELFSEDIRWHHMGTSILSGDYSGLGEIFEHFARRAALTGNTYEVVVLQAIAADQFISVVSKVEAKRDDGKRYSDVICIVYRIVSGRCVEAWVHPAAPEAEAEFYG